MRQDHRNERPGAVRRSGGAASLLAWVALLAPVAACGGGGGGGGPSGEEAGGLALPARFELVPARGSTAPGTSAATDGFPPTADYFTAETVRTVYDTALEAPARTREVLHALAQVGTDAIVDGEPYLAQLERVERRGTDPSAAAHPAGRSFGRSTFARALATVRSRRDGSATQVVELWMPGEADGRSYTLRARATIERGVDASRPFGEFRLDYAALDGGGLGAPLFRGTIAATLAGGVSELVLHHAAGDLFAVPAPGESAALVQAHLRIAPGSDAGDAKVLDRRRANPGTGDTGVETGQFLLGYEDDLIVRAHDGHTQLIRSRESVREVVWEYGLFHATGPRAGAAVRLADGFGFRTASGRLGYVGPRGTWLAGEPLLADGEEATRAVYGEPGEAESFTVVTAPGRLVRHTRRDVPLAEVAGVPFERAVHDEATDTTSVQRVTFDAGQWLADGRYDFDADAWESIEPAEVVDTATPGYLDLWSDALGGRVTWLHGGAFVHAFDREPVDADDPVLAGGATELELFGMRDCLRAGLDEAEAEAGDVYLDVPGSLAMAHRYELHADDLTLYLDAGGDLEPVGLAAGVVPARGPNRWGMVSGPLVPDLAGLASDAELFGVAQFYTYETGPHPWNAFVGLRDAEGAMVEPGAPLRFEYRHEAAADRNGLALFDGVTFLLEYDGEGRLRGLPQLAIDRDGDGEPDRFEPRVNLVDGLLVGPTGDEYVVRALALEEVPRPGFGPVPSLAVASDLVFTDGSEYVPPAIGGPPEVVDPPRVVDGTVLASDEGPARP